MTTPLLDKKVVLIMGAATGIGRAACRVFAAHGARLVLGDINVDDGTQAATEINEGGGDAMFVDADITDDSAVGRVVAAALDRFGRLDCAFNNAGIEGDSGPLTDCTETNFDQVIAVNLKGVWLCLRHQIPAMLASGGGAIVNTSSAAGVIGFSQGVAAYTAAKHGVVGLTRAAALEFANQGIRINAICPGATRTPMYEHAITSGVMSDADIRALQPIQRLAEPTEIAQSAAWLCSDTASFITGTIMPVDGGMTAGR